MDRLGRYRGIHSSGFSDVPTQEEGRHNLIYPPGLNANQTDDVPWLYFIVFSNDFQTYEVYDSKLDSVEGPVALLGVS